MLLNAVTLLPFSTFSLFRALVLSVSPHNFAVISLLSPLITSIQRLHPLQRIYHHSHLLYQPFHFRLSLPPFVVLVLPAFAFFLLANLSLYVQPTTTPPGLPLPVLFILSPLFGSLQTRTKEHWILPFLSFPPFPRPPFIDSILLWMLHVSSKSGAGGGGSHRRYSHAARWRYIYAVTDGNGNTDADSTIYIFR